MLAEEDEAWPKKMEDDLKEESKCMKKIERMEALLEEERSQRKKVEEDMKRLWEAMQNKIDKDHKKEMNRIEEAEGKVWQEKVEEDLKKEKNRTEQLLEETERKQQNPKHVMYSDIKVWFAFAQ
jgi:hypothetical protein